MADNARKTGHAVAYPRANKASTSKYQAPVTRHVERRMNEATVESGLKDSDNILNNQAKLPNRAARNIGFIVIDFLKPTADRAKTVSTPKPPPACPTESNLIPAASLLGVPNEILLEIVSHFVFDQYEDDETSHFHRLCNLILTCRTAYYLLNTELYHLDAHVSSDGILSHVLCYGACSNDVSTVLRSLDAGVDFDSTYPDTFHRTWQSREAERTTLDIAIRNGCQHVAVLLLERCAVLETDYSDLIPASVHGIARLGSIIPQSLNPIQASKVIRDVGAICLQDAVMNAPHLPIRTRARTRSKKITYAL